MEIEINNLKSELDKLAARFKDEIGGIRSNRPTGKLIEDIKIDYFGQLLAVKQLSSISVVPPREIKLDVWDRNAVAAVAKAIEEANIGVSASVQGNSVKVTLPPLTEERRRELVKLVRSMAENYKIKIRSLRDDYKKKFKQAEDKKEISEDLRFKLQDKIQGLVDKVNEVINSLLDNKIKEIEE